MLKITRASAAGIACAALMTAQLAVPALADYKQGYAVRTQETSKVKSFFVNHPKIKSMAVGSAAGTAAGAATGLIAGRGVVRGAAVGAGTGAGVGLVRSSRTLAAHPVVKDTLTGSVAGLGLGYAASRGHKTALKSAAVGTAIGLGAGFLRNELKKKPL